MPFLQVKLIYLDDTHYLSTQMIVYDQPFFTTFVKVIKAQNFSYASVGPFLKQLSSVTKMFM